jgi:hypothetical protein
MSPLAKINSRLAFVTSSGGLFSFVQHNLPPRVTVLFLSFYYIATLCVYSDTPSVWLHVSVNYFTIIRRSCTQSDKFKCAFLNL